MSLQGLVDATATALGGARDMYGPAATATGLPSTAGLQSLKTDLSVSLDSVPQTWRGSGGEGYKQSGGNGVAALDNVIGADGQVGPQVVAASTDSRDGRSGMNGVVNDTRNGVNAIAPSTDTPAGKQALVNHLDGQLDRAKALLTQSQQRGQMLSAMIRNAGAGYGGGPMGGAGMGGGGMPMGGMGGSMGGMSPLGALNGLSGLSIPGLSQASARRASSSRGAAPASSAAKIPVGEVSFAGRGTFPKGPAAMSQAIDAALDARGVTDPVARKRWHDGYMTLTGRESGHNATVVNVGDSNAHGAQMSDGAPANSSRGPAQCIPGTFAAYHQPGTSTSIYEPVANIAASMNYVMDRHGVSPDGSNLAARVAQANPNAAGAGY
jgi:hypothetical protein